MSLARALRLKRFKFLKEKDCRCILETPTGARIEASPINCSMFGLLIAVSPPPQEHQFNNGAICPSFKLCWQGKEIALGRVIIKNVRQENERLELGLSVIDNKVPLDGELSKLLDYSHDLDKAQTDFELDPNKFSLANFIESEYSNVDLFEKTNQFQYFLKSWRKSEKYGYNFVREESKGVRVNLDRIRRGKRSDYIIMGSNDYLGLASDERVTEAVKNALDKYGFGSTGSGIMTGTTDLHVGLSDYISRLFQKGKALLYNSGYTANVGIINALVGTQDMVIADMMCHASIVDALEMSKAKVRYFIHNDMNHLEKILKNERSDYAGCMVITEGIFSMDGDHPPMDKIVELKYKYNFRIMVDQAHCFGVLGESGLGVVEKFHCIDDVDIIMGTFSKIAGGIGGFVACEAKVIDWLQHFSRPYLFSVSLPPSTVAGVWKALEIFRADKQLLQKLRTNIRHFVGGLIDLGYPISKDHESSIVPVKIGDEKKLGLIFDELLERGIYCVPVVFPGVAKNSCRFRFTISAKHTISDLDYVLNVLELALEKYDVSFEKQLG